MIFADHFTRRDDGRCAPTLTEAEAFEIELEARLALRKSNRPKRSQAALKGAQTKRRKAHA